AARSFGEHIDPADSGRLRDALLPLMFTSQSSPAVREEATASMAATAPRVMAELMTDVLVPGGPPLTPGTLTRPVLALEAITAEDPVDVDAEARLRALF